MKSSSSGLLTSIGSFLSRLSDKLVLLSAILLFISVIVMTALVFSRYLFKYSFPWAEELTRYLIVYMALLTAATVTYEREHITVNYFFDHLPRLLRYVLRLFFDICIFATMLIWIFVGFDTALFMEYMWSSGLGISMMWPYFAIPLSGIIMSIFLIRNFLQDLKHPDRYGNKDLDLQVKE